MFDGNAELKCTTPCNLNLAMGRHTLLVKNAGYREAQRVFTLPSDPGLIVNLEATAGMLSLVTNPAGLTVIIDGQEQTRKTPANFSLSVGEHRVQVLRGVRKAGVHGADSRQRGQPEKYRLGTVGRGAYS